MLENCRNAKERWGGVSDIIDRWLKERQDLIVRFCDMTAESNQGDVEKAYLKIRSLCQILVDYVSAGHFEVYEQLIQEAREFDDGGVELANRIIPQIEKTTEIAIGFNDRFDASEKSAGAIAELVDDMSRLGEVLEERFELEDVLIESLHNVHADQIA